MMELKNPIKMSKIRKRMSPPIPLIMRIIILFNWRIESSSCFIGHKDSHPKFHKRENHSWFSLVHKGWKDHWLEGRISKLPWDKEDKFKEGSWRLTKGRREYLAFWEGKGRKWVCEKKINSYVWKGVVHGKNVCKQEHGKKLFVVSTCSGVHGRISMTKPLYFYLK